MSRLNSWRIAFRMAWRDILKHKGRSVLAAALIFLPVSVLAGGLTALTTHDLGPNELYRPSPNVKAMVSFSEAGKGPFPGTGRRIDPQHPPTAAEVSQALGGVPVTAVSQVMLTASPATDQAYFDPTQVNAVFTDPRSPLNEGRFELTDGRWPTKPGEVVVTKFGRIMGLPAHGSVRTAVLSDRPGPESLVTIVGEARTQEPDVAFVGPPRDGVEYTSFLVGGSYTWSAKDANTWRKYGAVLTANDSAQFDPTPGYLSSASTPGLAIAVMSFVMVVALLAGPAFAASATRQRRSLGLLAANGGTRSMLRRTVLAQALVLGIMTATVGSLAGTALGVVAGQTWRERVSGVSAPADVQWSWILAIILVASLASLISAYIPARAAGRTNLLQALRGQVSPRRVRRRMPLLGCLGIVLGAGLFALALEFDRNNTGSNAVTTTLVIVATPLFFGGAVMVVPFILRACGALASHLPVTLRLAVRDVSRQRTRATAAIGAILATVAVFAGASIAGASAVRYAEKNYTPTMPENSAALRRAFGGEPSGNAASNRALQDVFALHPSAVPIWSATQDDPYLPVFSTCPKAGTDFFARPGLAVVATDQVGVSHLPLTQAERSLLQRGGAIVVGPETGKYGLGGALSSGESTSPSAIKNGQLRLHAATVKSGKITGCAPMTLPATAVATKRMESVPYLRQGLVLTTIDTLKKHKIQVSLNTISFPAPANVTVKLEHQLIAAAPVGFLLERETGPQYPLGQVLAAVTVMFGFIVLLTTVVTTLLSDAESRSDAATLAVVGAPTSMRRRVVAGQAFATGFIGSAIGIVIGMIPGLAFAKAATGSTWSAQANERVSIPGTYVIPVWHLLAVLVIVPLLAAVISMVFARRNPSLTRREA